jgi:hypothetical protein
MVTKEKITPLTLQDLQTLGPTFDALIPSRVRVDAAIRRSKGFVGSQKWEGSKDCSSH